MKVDTLGKMKTAFSCSANVLNMSVERVSIDTTIDFINGISCIFKPYPLFPKCKGLPITI